MNIVGRVSIFKGLPSDRQKNEGRNEAAQFHRDSDVNMAGNTSVTL